MNLPAVAANAVAAFSCLLIVRHAIIQFTGRSQEVPVIQSNNHKAQMQCIITNDEKRYRTKGKI